MIRRRRWLFLAAVVCGVAGLAVIWRPRGETQPRPDPRLRPLWTFDAPQPGASVAAPLIAPDAVYLAAVHARGIKLSGAVYCLDLATGKRRWTYTRDGAMLPTASSPLLAGGRLYLGEGMHANFACRAAEMRPAEASFGIVTLSCFELPDLDPNTDGSR